MKTLQLPDPTLGSSSILRHMSPPVSSSIPRPLPPSEEGEEVEYAKKKPLPGNIRLFSRDMRKNPTPAEKKFWEAVRHDQLGVRFRRQFVIGGIILDFYIPELRLAIELDGMHHRNTWQAKQDILRTEFLTLEKGIHVLRFSNNDVLHRLEDVFRVLRTYIDKRYAPPPKEEGLGVEETNKGEGLWVEENNKGEGLWAEKANKVQGRAERERTANTNKKTAMLSLLVLPFLLFPTIALACAVISEVMWMGSDLSTADEWVEMAGTGSGTLSGWTLTSLNSSGEEVVLYRFGEGDTIGSGEYLTVSNFGAEESRLLMEPRFVSEAVSLPNTKLLLRLRDADGVLRDEVDDGVGAPFAGENPSGGGIKASMERIDLHAPGNVKENWATAIDSQGFDDGAPLLGTPGFLRPIPPDTDPPLEAMAFTGAWIPAASGADMNLSWIPSVSTDLAIQHLKFDPALPDARTEVHLPASEVAYDVLSLSEGSGYTVTLKSEDGNGNVSAGVEITIQPYHKPKTGSGSSSSDSSASSASSASSIFITEVLADAVGSDDAEWVEIGNRGTESVDVAGWKLRTGTRQYILPPTSSSGFILEPGRHVAFRSLESKLSLPNAGGSVTLLRDGVTVDTITYPTAEEGVSYGRDVDDPTWLQQYCIPTEGAENREFPWNPSLVIQSGNVRGEERVTINVEANIPATFAGEPRCRFDFGDGFGSENCNPSSHVYDRVGRYILRADMASYCGNTSTQELTIEVYAKPSAGSTSPSTGGGGGAASSVRSAEQQLYSSSSSVGLISRAEPASSCSPVTSEGVVINEFLPDPEGKDTEGEWMELRNLTEDAIPLCGWSLGGAASSRVVPLSPFTLDARGYLLLPYSVSKMALRNSGETLKLSVVGSSGATKAVHDVTYPKAKVGKSYARQEDGTYSWTDQMTPGTANIFGEGEEESTKGDQEEEQGEGLATKTTVKKTTKKSSSTSSKKAQKKTTASKSKKSSASSNPNLGNAVPLLAGLDGEGDSSAGVLSKTTPVEVTSILLNAILIGAGVWWKRRRGV